MYVYLINHFDQHYQYSMFFVRYMRIFQINTNDILQCIFFLFKGPFQDYLLILNCIYESLMYSSPKSPKSL